MRTAHDALSFCMRNKFLFVLIFQRTVSFTYFILDYFVPCFLPAVKYVTEHINVNTVFVMNVYYLHFMYFFLNLSPNCNTCISPEGTK